MKWALIIVVFISGCISQKTGLLLESDGDFDYNSSRATPICEFLSLPLQSIDRPVTIQGSYSRTPHGRVLYDSRCPTKKLSIQLTQDSQALRDDKRLHRLSVKNRPQRIVAVYTGTFEARQIIDKCSNELCFSYFLLHSRVLAAKVGTPESQNLPR